MNLNIKGRLSAQGIVKWCIDANKSWHQYKQAAWGWVGGWWWGFVPLAGSIEHPAAIDGTIPDVELAASKRRANRQTNAALAAWSVTLSWFWSRKKQVRR